MNELSCARCGTKSREGTNFCAVCGARLGAAREARSQFMTILFVDLVGSTNAIERIGNEAMFELIDQFQRECQIIIQDAGGFVAKFMGDGAMAYFGYPRAMKDSAVTAVNCATKIIQNASNTLAVEGDPIQASCGVATGWSVVSDMRAGEATQEALAIGDTVNRASRLQSLASANSVFLSSEVRRSLDLTSIDLREVGETQLKGFRNPIGVWAIDVSQVGDKNALQATSREIESIREFPDQTDTQIESMESAPQLQRTDLLTRINTCFAKSASGRFAFADIVAPGGYGKTMLAEKFLAGVEDAKVIRFSGQYHKSEQSYACFRAPILSLMVREANDADLSASLASWAPEGTLDGLERLFNISQIPVAAIVRQQRISEALQAVLLRELESGPVILFVDDAQWLDEDTIAFLTSASQSFAGHPLFVLATHRLEGRNINLEADIRLDLTPLADQDANSMIDMLDPESLIDQRMRRKIIERAKGVPLYVYHFTMTVVEQPQTSIETAIPETLIEALQQRLDIGGDERQLVEAIAVLQENATEDVAALTLNRPVHEINKISATLINRGLLQQSGEGKLEFDHALLRDAVFDTLLETRARRLHKAALDAFRAVAPDVLTSNPLVEANHQIGSGNIAEAIPKLASAAQIATLRGEIAESVRVLDVAKGLLEKLENRAIRDSLEMSTQFALGNALVQQLGFGAPSVADAYDRALTLCESIDSGGEIEFQIAWGIWAHLTVVSNVPGAVRMIDRMQQIASSEPQLEVLSSSASSVMSFNLGEFDKQSAACNRTRDLYDLEQHRLHALTYSMDSLELALLFEAHGRFIAGDVDGWERAIAAARAHEEQLQIPLLSPYIRIFSSAARCYAPSGHPVRAEMESAKEVAQSLGQPFWVVGGDLWLAAERYHNQSPLAALGDLEAALAGANALGIELLTRYHESLLAHAYACDGQHDKAEALLSRIHTAENLERNRMIWPELLRLRAEARYLADNNAASVASDLDQAEQMARHHGALAWLAHIQDSRRRLGLSPSEDIAEALRTVTPAEAERHPAFSGILRDETA